MPSGCRFTVSHVEEGLAVDVDRDMLLSALGNLLQNAFKFTKPGTEVSLAASCGGRSNPDRKSRIIVVACPRAAQIGCSCPLHNSARTSPGWDSGSPSASVASRPIMEFSASATYPDRAASSPSTCRAKRFGSRAGHLFGNRALPSRGAEEENYAKKARDAPRQQSSGSHSRRLHWPYLGATQAISTPCTTGPTHAPLRRGHCPLKGSRLRPGQSIRRP